MNLIRLNCTLDGMTEPTDLAYLLAMAPCVLVWCAWCLAVAWTVNVVAAGRDVRHGVRLLRHAVEQLERT